MKARLLNCAFARPWCAPTFAVTQGRRRASHGPRGQGSFSLAIAYSSTYRPETRSAFRRVPSKTKPCRKYSAMARSFEVWTVGSTRARPAVRDQLRTSVRSAPAMPWPQCDLRTASARPVAWRSRFTCCPMAHTNPSGWPSVSATKHLELDCPFKRAIRLPSSAGVSLNSAGSQSRKSVSRNTSVRARNADRQPRAVCPADRRLLHLARGRWLRPGVHGGQQVGAHPSLARRRPARRRVHPERGVGDLPALRRRAAASPGPETTAPA